MTTALQQFVPQNLAELDKLAERVSKSSLIPQDLRGKSADVAVILLTGHELGLTPMQSLRSVHVIKGRPVLSADLMAALVQRSPLCEYLRVVKSTDAAASYETLRRGHPEPVAMSYTLAQAQAASLTGKDTWKAYPAAMLRARCVAAICRAVYPDLMHGVYETDESDDLAETRRHAPRVIEPPTEVIETTAEAPPPETHVEPDWTHAAQQTLEGIEIAASKQAMDDLWLAIGALPKEYRPPLVAAWKDHAAELKAAAKRKAAEPVVDTPDAEPLEQVSATPEKWIVEAGCAARDEKPTPLGYVEACSRGGALQLAEARWSGFFGEGWQVRSYPWSEGTQEQRIAAAQAEARALVGQKRIGVEGPDGAQLL